MNRGCGNVSKEEILVTGEIIHIKMQKHPLLIKDRRQQMRTYACCFSGKEVVEWLVKSGEALNHYDAVECMRLLQEQGIIHHVNDEHLFKNESLLYRFRIDDGTFFVDKEYDPYHQGIMIHQRVLGDSENIIMMEHMVGDKCLDNCFIASSLVSWLCLNDVVHDRYAAVALGQQLLDLLIIKPVIGDGVEFYDNETVYHFIFDVDIHFPLYQALNLGANDPASFKGTERRMSRLSMQDVDKKFLSKFWKGVWDEYIMDKSTTKVIDYNKNDEEVVPTLKPVILRDVTAEELMSKDSPYYWKTLNIVSDSVGFGFIIRGNGPCYVQAVDPTSPAADAGLKVRMYIYSVNGKVVLNTNHIDVGKEIVKDDVLELVVLHHFRSSGSS